MERGCSIVHLYIKNWERWFIVVNEQEKWAMLELGRKCWIVLCVLWNVEKVEEENVGEANAVKIELETSISVFYISRQGQRSYQNSLASPS